MSLLSNIYVITIKRNLDRQTRMTNLLGKHNLQFSFIDGIDGEHLIPEHLNKVFDSHKSKQRLGYALTKNEIACSLSHIKALKSFLENDKQDYALILEDDVEISNLDVWLQAVVCLPHKNKWDVLYLGYQNKNHIMSLPVLIKWRFIYPVLNFLKIKRYNLKKIRLTFDRLYNKHWIQLGAHNGAYAYLVNKNAAKKIIEYNTPLFVQADVVLMDLIIKGKINAFGLSKTIFEPNFEIQSSIGNRATWE
jgi:GR25 family glycosyltransferase involved in LPS biosynthesis